MVWVRGLVGEVGMCVSDVGHAGQPGVTARSDCDAHRGNAKEGMTSIRDSVKDIRRRGMQTWKEWWHVDTRREL